MEEIKVLNGYAGIGGNRKLWPDNVKVTAVELNPKIAKAYSDFFPDDKVIVTDAHAYLLEHYKEFDFIWASPPCPTHSKMQRTFVFGETAMNKTRTAVYPDMALYQEIILLTHFFKGKFVIENVVGYYEPLVVAQKAGRHYFWTNFHITNYDCPPVKMDGDTTYYEKMHGFDLSKYTFDSNYPKDKVLRNCVYPQLGKHIFDCAFKTRQVTL